MDQISNYFFMVNKLQNILFFLYIFQKSKITFSTNPCANRFALSKIHLILVQSQQKMYLVLQQIMSMIVLKVQRNGGKWDSTTKKFQASLSQMNNIIKQLRDVDRSFHIQPIPNIVGQMLSKYKAPQNGTKKVRKQIIVDNNIVMRYQYLYNNVIKNVMQKQKQQQLSRNRFNKIQHHHHNNSDDQAESIQYNKILIITQQSKIITWTQKLSMQKCRRLKLQAKQSQICQKQNYIWLCPYDILWKKCQQLKKYCFQTIIIDQAQQLAAKLNQKQECVLLFKKFINTRHFIFPIVNKIHLNKLDILLPLLNIVLPKTNFSWFVKRYRKQNLTELYHLIKSCKLVREVGKYYKNQEKRTYFNKILVNLTDRCAQKLKGINRKYNNIIDYKKVLQTPTSVHNKNQRNYIQVVNQTLRQQKQQQIYKFISYFCKQINTKLVIVIQNNSTYRTIQNYLCEYQISYCHYEHHQEVLEYNKNINMFVCLVKSQYLLNICFSQPLFMQDQNINSKLENYQPQQYLCFSGVKNVLFPDIQWQQDVRKKEQSIRQLFRYVHGDLVRHYFIVKGTYEEKWVAGLEEMISRVHMNMKVKQDILVEEYPQENQVEGQPAFAFCQLNIAQVQQQYSHLKIIKGVTDIDDQFDKLEFQALQQKKRRQAKKKRKQEKAQQKIFDKSIQQIQEDPIKNKKEKIKQILTEKKDVLDNQVDQADDDEIYQRLLTKKKIKKSVQTIQVKQKQESKIIIKQKQVGKVTIYEPMIEKIGLNILKQIQSQKPQELKVLHTIIPTVIQPSIETKFEDKQKKLTEIEKQQTAKQIYDFKQGQTQQVQIVQVRKPTPKPKIQKQKSQAMKVILRPSIIG